MEGPRCCSTGFRKLAGLLQVVADPSLSLLMDFLRNLDAYPKLKAEYTTRTAHGACSSIVAILIMTYLFVSEFIYYSSVEVVDRLSVNSTHAQRIVMRFDIVFPHIPCDLLSLDAMDSSGQRQEGVVTHIYKKTIDPITLKKTGDKVKVKELGTLQHEHELGDIDKSESKDAGKDDAKSKCGNCYGAQEKPEDCCNTCEEVCKQIDSTVSLNAAFF